MNFDILTLRRAATLSLAILLMGAAIGCKKKNGQEQKRPAASPYVVEVVPVKERPFRSTLFATGTLRAQESVNLQAERSGIITGIYFEEGKQVKAGDVLVTIDDTELQAQLRRAKAELDLAILVEKRTRELYEEGRLVSRSELDESEADLNVAKAAVQLIEAQLAKTKIVAPFDAVVGLRHVSQGAYVTPGTSIASLHDIRSLKLDFTVPERYLPQLRTARTVAYKVAGSDSVQEARIVAIEPSINVSTRSIIVRAIASNHDYRFLPGAFAEVDVILDEIPNAILIPAIALVPGLKEQKVFVHKNGQVEERIVRVGVRTDDSIQVMDGLKAGDEVVVSGVLLLRSGMKVQARKGQYNSPQGSERVAETNEPEAGAGQ